LGVAGLDNATLPPDVRRIRIVPGKYERFVAEGDPAKVVWQTWNHINGDWERRGERRYLTDFERYAPESMAGGTVKVDILVGLRSSSLACDLHANLRLELRGRRARRVVQVMLDDRLVGRRLEAARREPAADDVEVGVGEPVVRAG